MTTSECQSREQQMISRIEAVFFAHRLLREYAAALKVSVENAVIVIQGELPSVELKAELIPAIRIAGVLGQVNDRVIVAVGATPPLPATYGFGAVCDQPSCQY